ncbi:HEAT repeat domain-containing protein [Lentzea sp. BCCO 10_0856]|uniref:HEAT repeat domain-containing protein n=1 Tax=Lentzea miocenica TaxID=3095431 RepID=A0ABU4SZU4_9PSEU|nr:HEAT repeat domain-containing protein [Lentzea sp. BCCO 10_0856]MDX8031428.1 HEAT repeat domain-containing protein [Lentzea sp. BCCO 10_0856]
MTERAGLAGRVVEVLVARGDAERPQWSVGSGFVVREGLVLTAAHVVDSAREVLVRVRGTEERQARVAPLPGGGVACDIDIDLAVLEIQGGFGWVEPVGFARLHRDPVLGTPNLDGCVGFGFPRFQRRERSGRPVRESVRIDGYIPMGEGVVEGLATLRIQEAPHGVGLPGGQVGTSPWQGVSGTVVFCGDVAIGVVSEHHPPAGMNGLTVVPLSWLDRCADAAEWWALLGVADPGSLPTLPSRGDHTPEADAVERFRGLVLRSPDFTRLSTPFGGLSVDYYQPRLLRPVTVNLTPGEGEGVDPALARPVLEVIASVPRLVVIAPAGMGKTALLHDVARRAAAGDIDGVPVFVRLHDFARRGGDRDLLTFAVVEAFGDVLREAELDRIVTALRGLPELLFLFDGFDELPVDQQEDVMVRVRKVPRFLLTSRPMGRIDVLQDSAPAYQIEPLTDQSVATFVECWATPDRGTAELLDRVAADTTLAELTRFPQLLMLLCWQWWHGPSTGYRSKKDILSNAVDEAFNRAVRLARLSDGDDEVLPMWARRALGHVAVEGMSAGDGRQLTFTRERLVDAMRVAGGGDRAGTLLALARRSGLIVSTGAHEFRFLHHVFRAFLGAEALITATDPAAMIDRLALRSAGEDCLALAAALAPDRIAALIVDRLTADDHEIFRANWRLAAQCMEGLADLRGLEDRLRPVADAMLDGAAEWWSRSTFVPAIAALRTGYVRDRLLANLDSDDGYVRWAAVEGLGRFAEPRTTSALIGRLEVETWPAIQIALVTVLSSSRDRRAIAAVWEFCERCLATDPDAFFVTIGESLGKLGAEQELRQLLARGENEENVAELLAAAVPHVRPAFAQEILDSLEAWQIVVHRPEDVPKHIATLDDPSATTDQRMLAVRGLAAAGTDEAARELLAVLLDDHPEEVHRSVVGALLDPEGEYDQHALLEYLREQGVSDDSDYRLGVANAVLQLWNHDTRWRLDELSSAEFDEQERALLSDPVAQVRAAWALLSSIAGLIPQDVLAGVVDDEDPWTRRAVIRAAGRWGLTEAGPEVLAAARTDEDLQVRCAALEALGTLQPDGTEEVLSAAVHAADPRERRAAVAGLGRHGGPAALPVVAAVLLREGDPDWRGQLIDAIEDLLGPEPIPPELADALVRELDSPEPELRASAIRVIGRAGLLGVTTRLRAMMNSDPSEDVRSDAAEAYGLLAEPEDLVALLDEMLAAGPTGKPMFTLTTALGFRDQGPLEPLYSRLRETGGRWLTGAHGAVLRYPSFTYSTIESGGSRSLSDVLEALAQDSPPGRWDAVIDLSDHWAEDGVLGLLASTLLDEDEFVCLRAGDVLSNVVRKHPTARFDAASMTRVTEPETLAGLVGLLGEGNPDTNQFSTLFARPEFLPALLRADANGNRAVRVILWDIAVRYELRLLSDGRVVLPSGDEVSWDDAPALLG